MRSLPSMEVVEKVSGRHGHAEDGLLQLPANPWQQEGPAQPRGAPAAAPVQQLKQGVMAEKRDLQNPGAHGCSSEFSNSTRANPWAGCKVQAGTLAKACLPPA